MSKDFGSGSSSKYDLPDNPKTVKRIKETLLVIGIVIVVILLYVYC